MTMPRVLRLRPDVRLIALQMEHAGQMYEWMCDPEVSLSIGLGKEPSLAKTHEWLSAALRDPLVRPFAILLNGRHVGNVVLDRIDDYLATARLSIYIGEPSARGTGVGLSATYAALAEAFQTLNLHKVWLTVHARNFAAIHTYSKLGFQLEGIHRDEFRLQNERLPRLYMGLLSQEFRQLCVETSFNEQADRE